MDKEQIQRLLESLEAGIATESEIKEVERILEDGLIDLEDIEHHSVLVKLISRLDAPSPSAALDHRFYSMLSAQKAPVSTNLWSRFMAWPPLMPRLAVAVLMLIVGMGAGYLLHQSATKPADAQIADLSQQVSDLQEMIMLSLLEKGSTTERLKAVNLTQQMEEASQKVTTALLQTLNHDENVNVRLAALEALKPYVSDGSVRKSLIESISRQESPLVQVALAELMVALQEKASVRELERIVASEKTPAEVKKRIRETIEVLI
jgi:hypothetical protein